MAAGGPWQQGALCHGTMVNPALLRAAAQQYTWSFFSTSFHFTSRIYWPTCWLKLIFKSPSTFDNMPRCLSISALTLLTYVKILLTSDFSFIRFNKMGVVICSEVMGHFTFLISPFAVTHRPRSNYCGYLHVLKYLLFIILKQTGVMQMYTLADV